jgi:hypothetical protein
LVDSDHYLFALYKYIEMNPVRAGMVMELADYKWSSYAHKKKKGSKKGKKRAKKGVSSNIPTFML